MFMLNIMARLGYYWTNIGWGFQEYPNAALDQSAPLTVQSLRRYTRRKREQKTTLLLAWLPAKTSVKRPNNMVQRHKGNLTVSQAPNPNLASSELLIEEMRAPELEQGGRMGWGRVCRVMMLVVLSLGLLGDCQGTEKRTHAGLLESVAAELTPLIAWRHGEQTLTYE